MARITKWWILIGYQQEIAKILRRRVVMRASVVKERQSLSNGRRTPRDTIGPARHGQNLAMEAPRRGP